MLNILVKNSFTLRVPGIGYLQGEGAQKGHKNLEKRVSELGSKVRKKKVTDNKASRWILNGGAGAIESKP